jgi:hypothetical protein
MVINFYKNKGAYIYYIYIYFASSLDIYIIKKIRQIFSQKMNIWLKNDVKLRLLNDLIDAVIKIFLI